MLCHLDRAARFEIDFFGPIRRDVFMSAQKRAIGTIKDIDETIPIEVDERLDSSTINVWHVNEDVFVDAVIVPLIEGGHLVGPDRFAGVGLAGENGHRPLVVPLAGVTARLRQRLLAAAIARAPQARVTRAVINVFQFWIVAVPAPRPHHRRFCSCRLRGMCERRDRPFGRTGGWLCLYRP